MGKKVFSVTEITGAIKELLEQNIEKVEIKGEISNLSMPASGHVYFTLKDSMNQIKVAFFRGGIKLIKAGIKDGKEAVVYGKITIYGKRSEYQVIAERVETFGIGGLLEEFEKLKKKLDEAGLFNEKHKQVIPRFPKKIGIITSETGAAIRDVLNIISRRYTAVDILLYHSLVQGDSAPKQLVKGVEQLNKEGVDVIIITRGGGSIEDLWAFNSEELAYAVYNSKIPVISAVGHEIDFTICDFVADLRAPTPSAAAELVVPDSGEIMEKLNHYVKTLYGGLQGFARGYAERLKKYSASYAFKIPFNIYEDYVKRVDDAEIDIKKFTSAAAEGYSERITVLKEKLAILNPMNVLKKGYSVVYDGQGGIIKTSEKLREGDTVRVKFHKGGILGEVKKKV